MVWILGEILGSENILIELLGYGVALHQDGESDGTNDLAESWPFIVPVEGKEKHGVMWDWKCTVTRVQSLRIGD